MPFSFMKFPEKFVRSLGVSLSKAATYYRTFSVIIVNALLLFLLLNLLAQGYLDFKSARQKSAASSDVATYGHRGYDPSLASVYPGMDKSQISELIKETRKLSHEYDSYTQFKERFANGKYVKVDPNGFRNGVKQLPWPPDPEALNIFVFGGSTTFGYRVADDDTIPSHLQDLIGKETDLSAAVYNFGRGGYMSSQERALFEKLIVQGHAPNIAIFIDGLNEFALPEGEPLHTADLKKLMDNADSSTWDTVIHELPVMRLLLSFTRGTAASGAEQENAKDLNRIQYKDKVVKAVLERYRTNKKMTSAVAKTFNVTSVFVWQPVPTYEYDQEYNIFGKFDYDNKAPLLRAGYSVMAAEFQTGSLGNNFIWLADIQRDLKKPLYVDAVHYSGEMCNLIARGIFSDLRQKGIFSRGE